jgi:hypothetical protein
MSTNKSTWLGPALLLAGVAALVLLERRYPLRHAVEPGARRLGRNLAVGALTAATVLWDRLHGTACIDRSRTQRGYYRSLSGLVPDDTTLVKTLASPFQRDVSHETPRERAHPL